MTLAADKWPSVTFLGWQSGAERGEENRINYRIENNTAFLFGDFRIHLSDARNLISWFDGGFLFSPDNIEMEQRGVGIADPETLYLCLSALRDTDGALLKQVLTYGAKKSIYGGFEYRLTDTTGLQLFSEEEQCPALG